MVLLGRLQIRRQQRSQTLLIHDFRTPRRRSVHPHNDSHFDPKIKGNGRDYHTQQILDNGQERKDDPIRQPLCIIVTAGIHRFEGHVRGIDESQQIDQEFDTSQQPQGTQRSDGTRDKKVDFVISRLVFQILEFVCI